MKVQFIEPAIVPDVVVSRIAYMQEIAPQMWRIAFYNEQVCPLDGSMENVIVAKLIISRENGIACSKRAFREFAVQVLCLNG